MEKHIIEELKQCGEMLESHFHDMMDIEFTVENEKLYILSARIGKRTDLANIKIVLNMFCEGKIDIHDVFKKIPYQQVGRFLDTERLKDESNLLLIGEGLPACIGVASAKVCCSEIEAKEFIKNQEEFILCQIELSPDLVEVIKSEYCKGVITARGGMTSHAAVICRRIHKPCVSGFGDFYRLKRKVQLYDNELTIDGNNGKIYAGFCEIEKRNSNVREIEMLHKLLVMAIQYNIIADETPALIWRLWNAIELNKRYGKENTKRLVVKDSQEYVSFTQPESNKIELLWSKLGHINNSGMLVEDLIGFLVDELSAQVPLGCHYLYMRPILDPMKVITYYDESLDGFQLTGVEFFHINHFIDFLLDVCNIKIYFSTRFHHEDLGDAHDIEYSSFNYLDYTNQYGESLIINNYDVAGIAIYINDVLIDINEIYKVYHLIRRRKYYWNWYKENNVSKKEIIHYLKTRDFQNMNKSKMYYLCEEMRLINNGELTLIGASLVGVDRMENRRNIEYILDTVIERGYNGNENSCNDFSKLIIRKDFKDLVALELYEYYFWDERHEFDLELLKEIVENVADYFGNPETIKQIESGFLQTLPSAIIVSLVTSIWSKLKIIVKKNKPEGNSSWERIEKNTKKIDKEFENHDYILTEDIEGIFGISREEIQPLLKLLGCKCFVYKKRSIWIKPGTKEEKIKKILKQHNFKYRH